MTVRIRLIALGRCVLRVVSGRVISSEPVTAEQAPTAQRMVVHWPGAADDHVSLTWPDAF